MIVGPFELIVELITEVITTLLELQDKEPRAWRATVKHGSIRRKMATHTSAEPCPVCFEGENAQHFSVGRGGST